MGRKKKGTPKCLIKGPESCEEHMVCGLNSLLSSSPTPSRTTVKGSGILEDPCWCTTERWHHPRDSGHWNMNEKGVIVSILLMPPASPRGHTFCVTLGWLQHASIRIINDTTYNSSMQYFTINQLEKIVSILNLCSSHNNLGHDWT